MYDDKELLSKAITGDQLAWARFFNKYTKTVTSFCKRFVRIDAIAENMAQDGWLKFYKFISEHGMPVKPKTLLLKIAENTCLDEIRRNVEGPDSLDTVMGSVTVYDRATGEVKRVYI
jgi:RNA polymerase sigma-70 factor (ECF subfamily)